MIYGSVLASFCVEASVWELRNLSMGNRKALRNVQTDEPIRSAARMTINEEYRNLLRRSLIRSGFVYSCGYHLLLLVDRSVAFFVYDHHINKIEVFHWLTYPPPEVQKLVGSGVGDLDCSAGVGTIFAMAKGAARRLYQLIVADDFRISLGDVFGRYWRRPGGMTTPR